MLDREELKSSKRGARPIWRTPLLVVICSCVFYLAWVAYTPYDDLYVFIIVPVVSFACLAVLFGAAVERRARVCFSAALSLAVFLICSWTLLKHEDILRAEMRWLLFAHRYKAELVTQRQITGNGLRHLEWDTWGFVPTGNNTAYLVYDPADSLLTVARQKGPARVAGIPCEVPRIQQLEKEWYFVRFYTDEKWDYCPFTPIDGRSRMTPAARARPPR